MNRTYIICECGWNWHGDLNTAFKLIDASKECGGSMVKFQLYDVDKIKKPSDDNYAGLKSCQLTKDQMFQLWDHANNVDIEIGFSVFDEERLKWLDEIDVKRYKIASRTTENLNLCRKIVNKKKPVIASCKRSGNDVLKLYDKVDYLFCLSRREILRNGVHSFPNIFHPDLEYTGFSDHTTGIEWAIKAIDRGASVIEKHITLDRNEYGWDQSGSSLPVEFKRLVDYGK